MLRIGLLGAGHFGAFHARATAATAGVELAAVADVDGGAARALAATYAAQPFDDWRLLLQSGAIDAVAIAAPHHLHAEMAIAAAGAGKHVLLEKPMARTSAECSAIIDAAARHGVQLMVGQVLRFARPSLLARRMLAAGECGRPVAGAGTLIKRWMEPIRRDWHLDPALGGGMLMTAGIHALDQLIWLMDARVAKVSAGVATWLHPQEADDCAMLQLRFADGRFGQVATIGYRDGAMTYAVDLVCETATLRIDFVHGLSVGRAGVWTHVPGSLEADWLLRALEREWEAMGMLVRREADNPVPGTAGRHLIGCIEAALASAREGREVAVTA
jgi:predicted dehydrogenase